jgi:hypothetical protein
MFLNKYTIASGAVTSALLSGCGDSGGDDPDDQSTCKNLPQGSCSRVSGSTNCILTNDCETQDITFIDRFPMPPGEDICEKMGGTTSVRQEYKCTLVCNTKSNQTACDQFDACDWDQGQGKCVLGRDHYPNLCTEGLVLYEPPLTGGRQPDCKKSDNCARLPIYEQDGMTIKTAKICSDFEKKYSCKLARNESAPVDNLSCTAQLKNGDVPFPADDDTNRDLCQESQIQSCHEDPEIK